MSSKTRTAGYWIATILLCLPMTFGGVADLIREQGMAEVMAALGYPLYLLPFLGVAKLLGVLAVVVPGRPILKEWAYAGFTFDLLGAAYSHAQSGDGAAGIAPPLVILVILVLSYVLRPPSRRVEA